MLVKSFGNGHNKRSSSTSVESYVMKGILVSRSLFTLNINRLRRLRGTQCTALLLAVNGL